MHERANKLEHFIHCLIFVLWGKKIQLISQNVKNVNPRNLTINATSRLKEFGSSSGSSSTSSGLSVWSRPSASLGPSARGPCLTSPSTSPSSSGSSSFQSSWFTLTWWKFQTSIFVTWYKKLDRFINVKIILLLLKWHSFFVIVTFKVLDQI